MQTTHLTQDYTDQAINLRYKERLAAAMDELGLTDPQQLSQHPLVLQALHESMRRDYVIQVAIRDNKQAQLKTLLT